MKRIFTVIFVYTFVKQAGTCQRSSSGWRGETRERWVSFLATFWNQVAQKSNKVVIIGAFGLTPRLHSALHGQT